MEQLRAIQEESVSRFKKEDAGHSLGQVEVITITDKALLVKEAGTPGDKGDWYPKSQIHSSSELDEHSLVGETGELVITEWLATQKGLV